MLENTIASFFSVGGKGKKFCLIASRKCNFGIMRRLCEKRGEKIGGNYFTLEIGEAEGELVSPFYLYLSQICYYLRCTSLESTASCRSEMAFFRSSHRSQVMVW